MFSFLTPYLTALKTAAIILLSLSAFYAGYHYKSLGDAAMVAQAEAAAIKKQQVLDKTALDAAVADAKAQQQIVTVTHTIIQKVTRYVQKTDACPLSSGYVGVWNASVSGTDITANPGKSDAAPSGVTAVDALNNAVENFGSYHSIAQQLSDLQNLIRRQENVK